MPVHEAVSSRFPLLDGITSADEFFNNPELAERRRDFDAYPEYEVPEVGVRTASAPGPHGEVPVRVYTPDAAGPEAGSQPGPGLVWMHGGAFLGGSVDMPEADWVARELALRARAVVVSVDYRLAVGGVTYPVPHDDVVAAVRWVRDHGLTLGIDPEQVYAGGASAGANLATGAALKLRDEDQWQPRHLVLAYPGMHPVNPPPSAALAARMAEVPALLRFPAETISAVMENYLGGPVSRADGYAMPSRAELAELCPTLVLNAEYDDLRPSGEAFCAALALAGVDVHQMNVKGMLHGFLNLPATIEPVGAALDTIAGILRTDVKGRIAA
ncbi:alpha/beta hydrolase [Streptomyces sp. NPDC102462]|uniref:alpha/beta hydrolase n=1 Tax=Streptomyces sp. NPDC102462 TaxID=3366178 RepID=UPI0037F5908A